MYDKIFLSKVTILYVEDEKYAREETSEVFESFFKEVHVAKDGQEALDIYNNLIDNQKEIDVIVSDINMPNMDGLELLAEVRKISDDIPFIFTTAYEDSPKILKAIKHKVTSYVVKPVNISKLIIDIQGYCKQFNNESKSRFGDDELNEYLNSIDKTTLILKTNNKNCITYVNNTFLEISKYESEELLGKDFSTLICPNMKGEVYKNIIMELNLGKIVNNQIQLKAKDNTTFCIGTLILPINNEKDKIIDEYCHISFLLSNQSINNTVIKKRIDKDELRLNDSLSTKEIISEIKLHISKYKHMNILEESLEREKREKHSSIKHINEFEKNQFVAK